MSKETEQTDLRWRLKGDLARRHRFAPLVVQDIDETSGEASWQDYQQAFDKGYHEGVQKGYEAGLVSGEEEGHKSGYAVGFNQGRIEGQQTGKAAIDEQLNSLIAPVGALKSLLEEGHVQQINQQQNLILELVRRVALQVIRCELTLQPQQILALVEETLAALPNTQSDIKIHLEPNAVEKLKELAADKIQQWTLVPDTSISAGGCRIVSDTSDADASLETRLDTCMNQVRSKLKEIEISSLAAKTEQEVEVELEA